MLTFDTVMALSVFLISLTIGIIIYYGKELKAMEAAYEKRMEEMEREYEVLSKENIAILDMADKALNLAKQSDSDFKIMKDIANSNLSSKEVADLFIKRRDEKRRYL